jgi:ethanolamine utilization protein EutN
MILARIVGTIVSTRKDPRLEGCKLLIVKPISPETVLVVSGSAARLAADCKDRPVDAAIIGIVDTINLDAQHESELAISRRE